MHLSRRLSQFAAAAMLAMVVARLPAGEQDDPAYELPLVLPRCPDDAAAIRQSRRMSSPMKPGAEFNLKFDGAKGLGDDEGVDADFNGVFDNVDVSQGNHHLQSQQLTSRKTGDGRTFDVNGAVKYSQPDLEVEGASGILDDHEAAMEDAKFRLPTRPARGQAQRLSANDDGIIKLTDVEYTTCPDGQSDWLLKADEITIDTGRSVGYARDARVQFLGVTFLRLPVISFPVGNARKTGFLFPSIGTSTRGGVQVSVPWYWNIAPAQDFTFQPTWYASRGVDLQGEYRFLTRSTHGQLLGNLLPEDDRTGRARSRWRINTATDLPGRWQLTLDGENVSDARYYEDFAQTGTDGASIAFLPRTANLAWRDENLHAGVLVRNFQTLDQLLTQPDRPATEAPRFYMRGDWRREGALPLAFGVDAEATRFRHPGELEGWRLDAQPRIGLDYSGPGYFFRPTAMLDAAGYDLKDNIAGSDDRPTRTLPLFSVDTGLIFEREGGSSGTRRVTLEPRLMYLYAPYRDQSDLPLFDTGEPDLNWVELFRSNRFVGLDRISDANQVSFGITTQVFRGSGRRLLSATIGQTFNFTSPRVRLPGEPPDAGDASDLIAQVELTAWHNWSISTGLQWDPYTDETERAEVRLQYRPADRSVLNVGYRYQNNRLEQAEASTAWPITSHWRFYGRMLYSLSEKKSIEQFGGLEYGSCCWNLRAVARDYVSRRTGEHDRSIYVQLELKGLSNVGQAADAFLEKAIRGYSSRQRP
jgi:LPS-assembly protein